MSFWCTIHAGMAEFSKLSWSSSLKSKMPISDCLLLSETSRTSSRYQDTLMTKYGLNPLKIIDLDKIKEYDLSDLAGRILGTESKDDNETLALRIVRKCIGSAYEYQNNSEPKIKNVPISHLQKCYISTNSNKGDVLVSFEGSNVLLVEVHSSTKEYDSTARKTVYLTMEILRMFKAFGVMQPTIDAFVFPRKECARCVIKVNMIYDPNTITFQYSIMCLPLHEVSAALVCAVHSNKVGCQHLTEQPELNYTIWLMKEERRKWGQDFSLVKSGFGILLMNDTHCLKKPIYSASFTTLALLAVSACKANSYIPDYKTMLPSCFVQYNRVQHDPLNYQEARSCSLELTRKVYEVIRSLHDYGFMHKDLRLPNICFNVHFEPVLIDLDFSNIYRGVGDDEDMQMFGNELINCFNDSRAALQDDFIQNFIKGKYYPNLLANSVVARGRDTVQAVIMKRSVSE